MNSRPGVTATTDMAVLLSELQALPSGLEALRAGSGAGGLYERGRFNMIPYISPLCQRGVRRLSDNVILRRQPKNL